MTTPRSADHDQLAQATTRSLPPDAPADEETAALRDGWLSLGSAIDRANAGFCEDDLMHRLLSAQEHETPQAIAPPARPTLATRSIGQSRAWPAILGSALALTMLLAVSRTFWEFANESWTTNPRVPAEAHLNGGLSALANDGWSDSLDQELADAARQVRSLVAQATQVDTSLSTLAEHLDTMSGDLTHDSL